MAARIARKKSPPKPDPVEETPPPVQAPPPGLGRRLLPALFFMGVLAAMVYFFHGSEPKSSPRPSSRVEKEEQAAQIPTERVEKLATKVVEDAFAKYKARYDYSKASFNAISSEDADDIDRDDLLAISQDFYTLYVEAKSWPNRPAALYRAAEVMAFSAKITESHEDNKIAVSLFERLAKEFPQSILADDALYAAARIIAFDLKDTKKALGLLADLRTQYPQGDKRSVAAELEKKLLPPPPPPKKVEPIVKKPSAPQGQVVVAQEKPIQPKKEVEKASAEKPKPLKSTHVPELVYKPVLMPASLFMSQAVHVLADAQRAPPQALTQPLPVPNIHNLPKLEANIVAKVATSSKADTALKAVSQSESQTEKKPEPSTGIHKTAQKKTLKEEPETSKKLLTQAEDAKKAQDAKKIAQPKLDSAQASANPKHDAPKKEESSFWQQLGQSVAAFWQGSAYDAEKQENAAIESKSEKTVAIEAVKKTAQSEPKPKIEAKPAPSKQSQTKDVAKVESKPAPKTVPKSSLSKEGASAKVVKPQERKDAAPKLPVALSTALPKPIPPVPLAVSHSKGEKAPESAEPKAVNTAEKQEPKKVEPQKTAPAKTLSKKPTAPTLTSAKNEQKKAQSSAPKAKPTPPISSTPVAAKSAPSAPSAPKSAPKSASKPGPGPVAEVKTSIPPAPAFPSSVEGNTMDEKELNQRMRNARTGDLAAQLGLSLRTVYVDIGHGGKDQGTAHNGLIESAVVLDIGQKVGALLEKQGFNVVYSRTKNIFIPLSARSEEANMAGADVFVSIHMNAFTQQQVYGFETYYLDFSRNSEASRVATLENSVSDRSLGDLQNVLAKMLLNVRTKESQGLAKAIQRSTLQSLRAKGFKTRDGGTRSAPFHVLIGTAMPAVLVEVGYCTNKNEAEWLKRNDYRMLIARGIVQGILAYKRQLEKQSKAQFTAKP